MGVPAFDTFLRLIGVVSLVEFWEGGNQIFEDQNSKNTYGIYMGFMTSSLMFFEVFAYC